MLFEGNCMSAEYSIFKVSIENAAERREKTEVLEFFLNDGVIELKLIF